MQSKGDGVPILLLSFNSIVLKARQSGMLLSCILSEITIPQLLQIISPHSGSAMTVLSRSSLHIGQIIIQANMRYRFVDSRFYSSLHLFLSKARGLVRSSILQQGQRNKSASPETTTRLQVMHSFLPFE